MNTQNNVEETHNNNSSLITREEIEGTPFTIVTNEGKSFLTMGKYKISEEMEKEEIAIYMIENKWNIIVTIAGIIAEHTIKAKQKP